MLQTTSILIIDQEPTIAELLSEILTDAGYIAYSVPDDASALITIAGHPPALIVLDVGRVDMHNAQRIETMRHASLPSLAVVATTTAPRDAAALLMLGADECLGKPFDIDELLTCVGRYVQPSILALQ